MEIKVTIKRTLELKDLRNLKIVYKLRNKMKTFILSI